MEVVFWAFLILSVYPYLIYPGLVYLISKRFNRPWMRGDNFPRVTLIISVYNEEKAIEGKIRNALSLGYPKGLLEVIVVSDGSSDRTNEIVSGFKDSRLALRVFPERLGKTVCLNRVVPEARGDIILFTDANSIFPWSILSKLVKNFADKDVGLVTGWTKYTAGGTEEETSGIYSRLEMKTKYWESLICSCVGADGAIFGIRKNLYRVLDDQDINDFVIPLHVISQGKRVVLDPDVYCLEEPSRGDREEYRRQVRITNRTLRAIRRNLIFLNPFSFRSFTFLLLSHKLLRFLVPFFLAGSFVTNLFLLKKSLFYVGMILMQVLLLSLGLANISGRFEGKLANLCKFLLVTFYAQFMGWVRVLRRIPDTMWTPQR
jgi:cellulose synthase/poly-beta-1,6-N-acetylglucosamine synthase-like glycosyltransferase